MNETTPSVPETPSNPKLKLTRKGLIVLGSAVGMLIAGGFAIARKASEDGEPEVDQELVDEINSIEIDTI